MPDKCKFECAYPAPSARQFITGLLLAYQGLKHLTGKLEIVPDPGVPFQFAVRHTSGKRHVVEYLVNTATDEIQEVKFRSWPPRERRLA